MAKESKLVWDVIDDVLIGYGTSGKVSDEVWERWVEALKTPAVTRVLNVSDGSIDINSVQRSKASAVLKKRGLRVAVVTDEILIRGMVTAVSWFIGNSIKSFTRKQIPDAIYFLDSSDNEELIVSRLDALQNRVQSGLE